MYFRSSRTGRAEVWKVPASGRDPAQVTKEGGELGLEAADGKLYFSKRAGDSWSLWKRSADRGETQVLPSVYPYTNFFVVGEGIYFTPHPNHDGSTSVQFFRFADGKTAKIAELVKPIWFGLGVAPDEKSLLYTQVDRDQSNLMLIEQFR